MIEGYHNSKTNEIVKNTLGEIYENLIKNYTENHIGLMSGSTGTLLFLSEYEHLNSFTDNSFSQKIIENILDKINSGYNLPTFASGIYGIGWAFSHLHEENIVSLEDSNFFSEFSKSVDNSLDLYFESNNYDFLHGYIGIGIYILKRLQKASKKTTQNNYYRILERIFAQLSNTSKKNGNSIFWESTINKEKKIIGVDLSLAHGISGIINFLSRLSRIPKFNLKSKILLQGACNYLLELKRSTNKNISVFPNWVFKNQSDNNNSRLAWCYGDLGIGISLWHASKILQNNTIRKEALELFNDAANRKNRKENLVFDGCVCHGAFGIMLIFDYIFKQTKVKNYSNAANYWLQQGLKSTKNVNGEFLSYQIHNGKSKFIKESNILNGDVGIGLSLLTYLNKNPRGWSQCLMIS